MRKDEMFRSRYDLNTAIVGRVLTETSQLLNVGFDVQTMKIALTPNTIALHSTILYYWQTQKKLFSQIMSHQPAFLYSFSMRICMHVCTLHIK